VQIEIEDNHKYSNCSNITAKLSTQKHEYYLANKVRINQRNRQYYHNNKQKVLGICKRYVENHKPETAQRRKKWAEENREKISERQHNWYLQNRARLIQRARDHWHVLHPDWMIPRSKRGFIPWNKGKSGYHLKISEQALIQKNLKIGNSNRGRKASLELRARLAEAHGGASVYVDRICPCCGAGFRRRECDLRRAGGWGTFCSQRCKAIATVHAKRDTTIEIALQKALLDSGVSFVKQFPILGVTRADIALPEKRIAIFADGDYWHSKPEVASRDTFQTMMLSSNGWRVLRFSEREIRLNIDNCMCKILEVMNQP
jgi:DNA mismatch endonuclease (patch repair protein)